MLETLTLRPILKEVRITVESADFPVFDTNDSSSGSMVNSGYNRGYDCG